MAVHGGMLGGYAEEAMKWFIDFYDSPEFGLFLMAGIVCAMIVVVIWGMAKDERGQR